jgi:hypothetical protein
MRVLGLIAATLLSVFAASSASAGSVPLLLDHFTGAVNTDGAFQASVTRSFSGFSGGVNINTGAGEARLTADNLENPTSSGLVYDFSPHQAVCARVTVTARNRQTSATETGVLAVRAVTGAGTYTLSQTLPGNTPTMQSYDFDFSALTGPNFNLLQRLEITWDLPSGGTGLRGLAIDKIDLYEVPEPATIALIGLASSCGGFAGYRRRKLAAKKK